MIIKQFILALIPLIIFDAIWLFSMKSFYSSKIGHLMAQNPKWIPVALFYVAYAVGITILIALPAQAQNFSYTKVFLMGALLGFVAYGAYDFTNHAILKDWSTAVTIIDLAWGTFLTGAVSLVSVLIGRLL